MKETNGKSYNVDSFNLDHTKVKAPYVRKAAVKVGPKGDAGDPGPQHHRP